MTEPESRVTDLYQSYFSSAIQYYIAGRYAVFAGLNPVAGNLLHHAVEMAIEGHFSKTSPDTNLKKKTRDIRWSCSGRTSKIALRIPHLTFNGSTGSVSELDKFEAIRYPEHVMEYGMLAKIASHPRSDEPKGKSSGSPAPRYSQTSRNRRVVCLHRHYLGRESEILRRRVLHAGCERIFDTRQRVEHLDITSRPRTFPRRELQSQKKYRLHMTPSCYGVANLAFS